MARIAWPLVGEGPRSPCVHLRGLLVRPRDRGDTCMASAGPSLHPSSAIGVQGMPLMRMACPPFAAPIKSFLPLC